MSEEQERSVVGIDPAIAATMGFSSFGKLPHSNKRRRYNSSAHDAFIAPADGKYSPKDDMVGVAPPSPFDNIPLVGVASLPARPVTNARDGKASLSCNIYSNRMPLKGSRNKGVRREDGMRQNSRWYTDYYDPQSNKNPWAQLEARMGISPRGNWTVKGETWPSNQNSPVTGYCGADSNEEVEELDEGS